MHYLVYKITNTVNNRIYIACHKTENIDEGYMGRHSGLSIDLDINTYGIDKFDIEILYNFTNPEDLFNSESQVVYKDHTKEVKPKLRGDGLAGWIWWIGPE